MRLVASLAALFLVFTFVTCTDGQGCSTCGKTRSKRSMEMNVVLKSLAYRLPGDLRPISYDLEIKPDIAKAKFEGQVNITAVWTTGGSMIKLNADEDLNIQDVRVRLLGVEDAAAVVDVAQWKFIFQKSELVIRLAQIMNPKDTCLVQIKYSGNITTNSTSGFFKREYMTSSGQTHAFLATQMRPEYARRFFPCLDEPEYKATFELRVARPKNMLARSNTPIKMSVEMSGDPEYVMDHFEKTPEMATYQLALMISDFEFITPTIPIDSIDGSKLEIRVWGRKEYLDSLSHVPNKIVRIMNYIQKYMGKSIGLPKLDIVAMPMYTAAKASDSWGLMFFRESELSSSLVWNTAYELIYQWIGQQHTPLKWNAYLLNKALNSFLASVTTVDIEPDEMEGKWPMTMLYSLYYEFGKTFPFSRVAGIRNEATSAKAELVFRMFNYTLGASRFREGVRKLIRQEKQHLETNETEVVRSFYANDIFKHLDEVVNETNFKLPSELTIQSIATPWYFRDRVPLVTVIRDYTTGQTGQITLSQSVYLREAAPPSNNQMSSQWDIPIVMITQDEIEAADMSPREYQPHTWMTKAGPPTMTIKDVAKPDKFIIVNPEEIGMFPVKYDTCNWKKLGTFLQGPDREKIPVLTRAKLVHDSWNLAYAGNLCFGVALNMTLFLKNERSHVVWEPVFAMIDHVGRRIEGSPVHMKFEAYICSLLKPLYAELGETSSPGEPLWKVHMRGLVKNFLCRAGYEPCVTEAREQFKKWMTDEEPDKGNPVANEYICPVFRWGTQEEWEFGLQRVINFPRNTLERKENERTYLLKTLAGCPKDKSKIERLLNVTILSHYVNFTDSDIHLIYSMLTGGAIGHSTLFNFLKDHWQLIKTRFEVKRHLWNGIINSATSSFNTQEGYDMVSELYESRKGESKAEDEVLEKALKNIEKETEWNHEHLPVINEWLDLHLNKEDLANVETTLSPLSVATSDAPVSSVSPGSSSISVDTSSSSIINTSTSTSSDSSSTSSDSSDNSSSSSISSSSTSVKPFAG